MEDNQLIGYASLVANALKPLNKNERFASKFAGAQRIILIDSPHWQTIAKVTMGNSILRVFGISKKAADSLGACQWDGYIRMDTYLYFDLMMKRYSIFGLFKKWIFGEIIIKGVLSLLALFKAMRLLSN